jgi:hypothetical protein
MTTSNLLTLAATGATAALAGWGNLAYRAGRARAERAALRPETTATATRVLRDYQGSERLRFQLINTLLVIATTALLAPMLLGGWDHRIPTGLAGLGLACLALVLGWLADFALRPLPDPTRPRPGRLSGTSVEADQ